MNSDWYNIIKLWEHVHIKHWYAFKWKNFAKKWKYILLSPGNFTESDWLKLKWEKEKYYTWEFPLEYLLSIWDLIIAMTDLKQSAPYLWAPWLVTKDNMLHNQRLWLVSITSNNINKDFLYHLFNSEIYRGQVRASATGSTVKHTAPERIYSIEVPLPPLPTQKRIASILSNYDNLIENNTRRIQILEEQAQTLYRQWFVEFKFPWYEEVEMIDSGSEYGVIPEGWEVKEIWKAFDVIWWWTPSKKKSEYWWWDISWFTPSDVTKWKSMFLESWKDSITDLWLQKWSAKLFPAYCVMMTSRATIWAMAINTKEASVNQGFIVCLPTNNISYRFIYLWLQTMVEYILTISSGATFKELSKVVFRKELILLPKKFLLEKFDKITKSIFDEIEILEKENINLKKQRDTLLPKLVSGEVLIS